MTNPAPLQQIRDAVVENIPVLLQQWHSIDAFPDTIRPFGGDSDDKPAHF